MSEHEPIRSTSRYRSSCSALDYAGRTIAALAIDDNELKITFSDGSKISLVDDGQSCCEHRYMVCDDDLATFIDADTQAAGEVAPKEGEDNWGQTHEIEFLHVKTSKGDITVANHNEHNGYYGGFSLIILQDKAAS